MKKGMFFSSQLLRGFHCFYLIILPVVFGLWGAEVPWNKAGGSFLGCGPFFYLVIWFSAFLAAHRFQFAYPVGRRDWIASRLQAVALILGMALGSFLVGRFFGSSGSVPFPGDLSGPLWAFFLFACYVTGPYLWGLVRFRRTGAFDGQSFLLILFSLGGLLPWCVAAQFLSAAPQAWALAAGTAALTLVGVFGTLSFRYLRYGEEKT